MAHLVVCRGWSLCGNKAPSIVCRRQTVQQPTLPSPRPAFPIICAVTTLPVLPTLFFFLSVRSRKKNKGRKEKKKRPAQKRRRAFVSCHRRLSCVPSERPPFSSCARCADPPPTLRGCTATSTAAHTRGGKKRRKNFDLFLAINGKRREGRCCVKATNPPTLVQSCF